jgi:hypothetical protein
MKSKKSDDSATAPTATSGPLAHLVDEKLNNSLAKQIAEELDKEPEEAPRSGANGYARGTAEHEDDSEV